jgi:hypothetical protein
MVVYPGIPGGPTVLQRDDELGQGGISVVFHEGVPFCCLKLVSKTAYVGNLPVAVFIEVKTL